MEKSPAPADNTTVGDPLPVQLRCSLPAEVDEFARRRRREWSVPKRWKKVLR